MWVTGVLGRGAGTTCCCRCVWCVFKGGVWVTGVLGEEGRDHLLLQVCYAVY